MANKQLMCPMCTGPVIWSEANKCYQCLICDYRLPDSYSTEEDPVIVPGGNQSSDDFLREFSDLLEDGYSFEEEDLDSVYMERDEDEEEVEVPPPLYAGSPKAMYKERGTVDKKKEVKMSRGKSKKTACRICGTDKTVRGGPLKRLYGPNKDVCLKCFYDNKEEIENEAINDEYEDEEAYPQPKVHTRPQQVKSGRPRQGLVDDLIIFNQEGEFIGRFNDIHEMAAAAAKAGSGAEVYRLMRVNVTVRVDIEGQQVF